MKFDTEVGFGPKPTHKVLFRQVVSENQNADVLEASKNVIFILIFLVLVIFKKFKNSVRPVGEQFDLDHLLLA